MNTPSNSPLTTNNKGATLSKGTLGLYEFNIKHILKEAWQKVHGIKGTYWKAVLFTLLILLGFVCAAFILSILFNIIAASLFHLTKADILYMDKILVLVWRAILIIFMAPLGTGIRMIAVKWSVNEKINASSIFQYYRYWQKLWVLPLIIYLLTLLGMDTKFYIELPVYIITIYVIASYYMFYPLIADRNLSIWEALEASRKAISYHWFKILWFIILLGLIIIGSLLTVGILLIWTLPMVNNSYGILYREIFGVQKISPEVYGV